MKIVFMGTPDFALFSLRALYESPEHEVLAVVTQPDKPGNRGIVKFSPVKQYALERGLPVHQFRKIRSEGVELLRGYGADIFVTAAYGQILSRELIDLPKFGIVNVHASLLPAYRGSSPIQWALINGEKKTGVTIMQTAEGLDTGDILWRKELPIEAADNAGTLFDKLGALGAQALLECLQGLTAGQIVPMVQDEAHASYFPMLKKSDGLIDWRKDAQSVADLVRGVTPWPGAYFMRGGKTVKVHLMEVASGYSGRPGEVIVADKRGLIVACGAGAVSLKVLQPEGKSRMSCGDFLNGNKISVGETLA